MPAIFIVLAVYFLAGAISAMVQNQRVSKTQFWNITDVALACGLAGLAWWSAHR